MPEQVTLANINTEIDAPPIDAHNLLAAQAKEPGATGTGQCGSIRALKKGSKWDVITPFVRRSQVIDNDGKQVLVDSWCEFQSNRWVQKDDTLKEGPAFTVRPRWREIWEIKTIGVLRFGRDGGSETVPEQHLVVTYDSRAKDGVNCASSPLVPQLEPQQRRAEAAGDYYPNYQIVTAVPYTGEDNNAVQTETNREQGAGSDGKVQTPGARR